MARRAADVDPRGRFLYILGRAKDVVIRSGGNIYSNAVQNVLAAHPTVGECGDRHAGRVLGVERVAVARLTAGGGAHEAELQCSVCERLAPFQEAPAIGSPPSQCGANAGGKIRGRELKDLFRERFAA
ncbi:hypothetical protein [Sphingomonas phyllosphaerae]|uniref:hypothetical protein n=1 Tax=Sphingomonas phyllosphaerae TaxID=257003 RepID=UPI002413AC31|nr:hypothetical protein [Sphingomonas phyllosphaerae]